jgi:Leucine-rich repeat (LRR) protein
MSTVPRLTEFILSYHPLHIPMPGVTHIGKALPALKGLKYLSMSKCHGGSAGGKSLMQGLADNTSLTYLNVSSTQLTGYWTELGSDAYEHAVVKAICAALKKNKNIEYLDLQDNRLFGMSQEKHKQGLAESNHQILTEGSFRISALEDMMESIWANGRNNGKLKYLNLGKNRISDNAATCKFCASPPLESNTSSEASTLNSRLSAIRPKSAVQDCVRSCPLRLLLQRLVDARQAHPSLRSLCGMTSYMSHMQCGGMRLCDHWCTLLASELKNTHTLTSLDISNNAISARGVRTLAAGIRENISLKYILLPSYRSLSNFDMSKKDINYAQRLEFRGLYCVNVRVRACVVGSVCSGICLFMPFYQAALTLKSNIPFLS